MNSDDRLIESLPFTRYFEFANCCSKHQIIVDEEIGKEIKSNSSPNII